ncbi:MAG: hypothetical protein LUQ38_00965 [Methanotrichaceae archaeon]|nr:hypothetical protein [Methanotrichaceae archaeon]
MKAKPLILRSIFVVLLILVILAGLSGVEAQGQSIQVQPYSTMMSSSSTASYDTSQYSQYYTIPATGGVMSVHIVPPQKYDLAGYYPTTVYLGSPQQAIPYSQYQAYATYAANSLLIQGSTSWTQYASVPQGASLTLLAFSSIGGDGYLYEITPTDKVITNAYYFYPGYSQLRFSADTVGQHILLFTIGNQASNAIVIYVMPYYGSSDYPS